MALLMSVILKYRRLEYHYKSSSTNVVFHLMILQICCGFGLALTVLIQSSKKIFRCLPCFFVSLVNSPDLRAKTVMATFRSSEFENIILIIKRMKGFDIASLSKGDNNFSCPCFDPFIRVPFPCTT